MLNLSACTRSLQISRSRPIAAVCLSIQNNHESTIRNSRGGDATRRLDHHRAKSRRVGAGGDGRPGRTCVAGARSRRESHRFCRESGSPRFSNHHSRNRPRNGHRSARLHLDRGPAHFNRLYRPRRRNLYSTHHQQSRRLRYCRNLRYSVVIENRCAGLEPEPRRVVGHWHDASGIRPGDQQVGSHQLSPLPGAGRAKRQLPLASNAIVFSDCRLTSRCLRSKRARNCNMPQASLRRT